MLINPTMLLIIGYENLEGCESKYLMLLFLKMFNLNNRKIECPLGRSVQKMNKSTKLVKYLSFLPETTQT